MLWVDHFGNCQLNVGPDEIDGWGAQVRVELGDDVRVATRDDSFADARRARSAWSSTRTGMLALVLDRRSAAEELGLAAGDQVVAGARSTDDDADAPGVDQPAALGPSATRQVA